LAGTSRGHLAYLEWSRLGHTRGSSCVRSFGGFSTRPAWGRQAIPRSSAQYQALLNLSFGHRCFIVITAAITEEVLYRAYAVGVGQLLLGSVWVACALSVAAFTLAHYKWGIAHMVSVLVPAVAFTLLFVLTRNVWLCIIAHAIVDGVGFLAMPAAARRRTRLQQKAS
jgi:membrane protease YdiL (CAAX protease family)